MANNNTGLDTTETLPEKKAKPYKSMAGKIQKPLLLALEKKGYDFMTPVQEKVLTELPSFTADCLVQAKTGTGKTIAFLLPALQTLLSSKVQPSDGVRILIISPTRELALQIKEECDMLTSELRPRLQCHTAFGGTRKEKHLKDFVDSKPTVLVATPGRLNDYLSDDYIAELFGSLQTLVLDEADRMLDAGFLPAINQILGRLPPKSSGWQGMCFSATIPGSIKNVLSKVLKPGYTRLSTVDPDDIPTIEQVTQYFIIIPTVRETFAHLYALIEQERRQSPKDFKGIVFGTTANQVALLYDLYQNLPNQVLKVYELHSRLTQNARTRTTEEFKKTCSGVMFASDVIGRGMDFHGVDIVIQVGLPSSGEQYVHRVGRTARAGNEGRAVLILTDREKFFLAVNKHLPIQPYPIEISASAAHAVPIIEQGLNEIDEQAKSKAYQAFLGFHKTFMKQLRLDPAGLVAMANEYAAALGCPETPMIDKKVVGKMGLRGTKGLNVGVTTREPSSKRPSNRSNAGDTGKRQRQAK
ncbi:hypothetical protein M433DRAFT_149117 [Acidomyces richmondensis BFW]|nr:MAG: hypothetical protein FE78DRAFT_91472 [Acidomyces sp. 'richmondensis']KYG50226.1 hypothetical protein M433DRAFT_149117 [Acidomyces richmondensis BFW]